MCGIAGTVAFGGAPLDDGRRAQAARMVAALGHRGPDGPGMAGDARAELGVARLAIRGLEDGAQPIVDPETGVISICNGELDNHRELRSWLEARGRRVPSTTDVAILPGLYLELGERFAERLVGAFAIAIWDPREQKLLLARDRAGERPLYYRRSSGELTLASELAALVASDGVRGALDLDGLRYFLRFGYFGGEATAYRDVRRVPPASVVTIDAKGARARRYWRWAPGREAPGPATPEAFDPVFRAAVRGQSDVDVEYGVFLSGGVDSSLVAAVAADENRERPPRAYTLTFGEESYNEGDYARSVADALGLESIAVPVEAEDVPDTLADLIARCGEPLADPAWIPNALLARRASQDIRIALGGEGADELFGGYPTYTGAVMAGLYRSLPGPARRLVRAAVERLPASDKKVALSYLAKRFVQAAELDGMSRHLDWVSNIPADTLRLLGVSEAARPETGAAGEVLLDQVQRFDLEHSLAEGLLTKADRAGMRWAVEARSPFLDVGVMEFATQLRPRDRARGASTKIFLKRYATRYLPKSIVYRRKRGLSVPLNVWLKGPLHDWARDRLNAPALAEAGIDTDAAALLLEKHCAREADHARPIWTLIVLSEWLSWQAGTAAAAQPQRGTKSGAKTGAKSRTKGRAGAPAAGAPED